MKNHLAIAIVVVALITPLSAMFMRPKPIPVERLLKNAETYLAAHPESDEAKYILARIHYLAFARCSETVPAFAEADDDGKPSLAPNWMVNGERSADLDATKLPVHATAALAGFRELVKKDPANGLYQLGLASLLEQIAEWRESAKPAELSEDLKGVTLDQARDSYLAAFRASLGKDFMLKQKPISGLGSLVSYEAGKAFIRLDTVEANQSPDLVKSMKEVTEGLGKLDVLPRGPITPMIFSMKAVANVDELLAPEKIVDFDLRGYGSAERTSWIKPATALLVWDPEKHGEITSGQQLFGCYTFRIFRDNGYDALAALDDDGNGVLEGAELKGIRAWFDLNSDAISSASEVRDLAELGIVGINVKTNGQDGSYPTNDKGLLLSDGKILPTWDWMAQPVAH